MIYLYLIIYFNFYSFLFVKKLWSDLIYRYLLLNKNPTYNYSLYKKNVPRMEKKQLFEIQKF